MALAPQLRTQVYNYLIGDNTFSSDESLRRLFIDARISAWRNSLPETTSRSSRVNAVIAEFDTMNNGYNTLALILQIISEGIHHGDARKELGASLARQVQSGSAISTKAQYERELAQLEDHYARKWTDADYYNRRKQELLALITEFETPQDIPVSVGVSPMIEQRLREEFDASAKQLVALRELISIYTEFGVQATGLIENMVRAHEACKQLAAQINAL